MRVTVVVHASLSPTLFLTRSSVWHEAQTVFTRFVATSIGAGGTLSPASGCLGWNRRRNEQHGNGNTQEELTHGAIICN
jgi:hypothetical protein